MGFHDSFFSGISSIVSSVAGSPVGQSFLGQLGQFGIQKLGEAIGFAQPVTTRGPAPGPLGRAIDPRLVPVEFGGLIPRVTPARPDQLLTEQRLREELLFFQPGGPGSPVRRGTGPAPRRPVLTAPPPSIPSSQPFGTMPGVRFATFEGVPTMPAFPIGTQQGFPPSPFATVTGVPALFQPASAAGALLKQLPGIAGGLFAGEALESFFGGGGGGTPMFRPTMAGARAQFFRTQNPATGQDTWFRPAGKPLLWSGDLTACKRVNKVARRAARKR